MSNTANEPGGQRDKRGKLGVYSSLVSRREGKLVKRFNTSKTKKENNLRPLPKEQPARFFAHFRWERIKAYWFSKAGLKRIGKIFAACVLIGIILVGALFIYYKSQLKEIQLNNLSISDTVNTYLDRNGVVLWEDKGDADYRLVVNEDEISKYVRQATVAIEDKKFYTHPGIDFMGTVRAALSTLTGRGVQGGSTLTQQLIKQLYFSDEAASANRGGITRKIKELILSIELEKMYSKEQILTMYLNESPYGGRRNGIESGAQTYFGKSAKDLNLAESALLAAIPNNPAIYNPYYEPGNERLIARQHKVLDDMVEMGYISAEEAAEAKEVPILDQILPESSQYSNMKAPHFVMEVKRQLEEKYGMQYMRSGGYVITTTLDYRAQEMAEAAVAEGVKIMNTNGSDNIALASVDVETAQVIAMVGSIDWNIPVYGEVNAATSDLEPGSTIKPVLDYAPLFSLKGDTVYSPGTILKDENIDSIYCAGYTGACALRNFTGRFYGNLSIRESLGNSLNIPAVKALKIVGIDDALEIAHGLGDTSYCPNGGAGGGLSIAIGSGCTVKPVEHANAYASFARGGVYKPLSYVLEIKEPNGKIIESWKDTAGDKVIDEEVAYEISSILSDASARNLVFGASGRAPGFVIDGVWTATKTGTSTTSNSAVAKDLWMASYSTAVATMVWNGRHDGSGLTSSSNNVTRVVTNSYMYNVHHNLYAEEGKWKSGDEPKRPSGIQQLTINGKNDIWPSWFKKENSSNIEKVMFNKNNYKRASDCTPASVQVEVEVYRFVDPVSGTELRSVPEPYLYDEVDTCDGSTVTPKITVDQNKQVMNGVTTTNELIAHFPAGSAALGYTYDLKIDGQEVASGEVPSGDTARYSELSGTENMATFTLYDENGIVVATATINLN